MTKEEITIEYSSGDLRLEARVRMERDDPPVDVDKPMDIDIGAGAGPVDFIPLKGPNVKTKAAFSKFLKDQALVADSVRLWCYRDVWAKLLRLLHVSPPLPDRVSWPRD